jgi:hypothetical protein
MTVLVTAQKGLLLPQKIDILQAGGITMPETELLIRKAETLPAALFEEAVHYIDYLSQKAQSAYFSEKLAEAEHEANKTNAVWLDENEFWNEDD